MTTIATRFDIAEVKAITTHLLNPYTKRIQELEAAIEAAHNILDQTIGASPIVTQIIVLRAQRALSI